MMKKQRRFIMGVVVVLMVLQAFGYSHSGRTDSSGGHKDNNNVSGLGYYHYHHGYGPHLHPDGVCPYSAKSTESSSSTSSSKTSTLGYGHLPDFKVYINGTLIDNSYADYPVFVFNDITYFPMTWDYCNALGLTTSYTASEGLTINCNHTPSSLMLKNSNNFNSGRINFTKPDFRITLNDKVIDNSSLQYPILVYKDITYFPLTWDFAVEELNSSIEFDGASLKIQSLGM